MPFEDELSEELRRTGETFDLTARTTVVDGALKQGRRSLRRRRSAAVASGGPAAPASLRGSLSEEKLAAVLEELLPPGKVSEARGEVTGDEKGPRRASASAVYDDGKGKGSVLLVVYPLPVSKAAKAAECRERLSLGLGMVDGDQGSNPGSGCASSTAPKNSEGGTRRARAARRVRRGPPSSRQAVSWWTPELSTGVTEPPGRRSRSRSRGGLGRSGEPDRTAPRRRAGPFTSRRSTARRPPW